MVYVAPRITLSSPKTEKKSVVGAIKDIFTGRSIKEAAKKKGGKVYAGALPIGGALATGGKVAVTAVKAVPSVGKFVKGVVTAVAVGGVIAGGGLKILPTIYKSTKKGTEILRGERELEEPKELGDVGKAAIVGGVAGLVGAGVALLPDIVKKVKERKPEIITPVVPETPIQELLPDVPKEVIKKEPEIVMPSTPETQTLPTTRRRKARKKRLEAQQQKISQSVRVNIINRNSADRISKRYINKAIYMNKCL